MEDKKISGIYIDLTPEHYENYVTKRENLVEPKTDSQKQEVVSLLINLLNEKDITYEHKMVLLSQFMIEIDAHSYGLFPD